MLGIRALTLIAITIINCEADAEVVYRIVGEEDASVSEGKISVASPIAGAIAGNEEGEVVAVHTSDGDFEHESFRVKLL